jgi:hypothetical protein
LKISEKYYGEIQKAFDLPAIDIQRGRDLGVQGYNGYRKMCGLKPAKHFEDLLDVMSIEVRHNSNKHYFTNQIISEGILYLIYKI